ncbi:tRNA uridine-5-carboxymethylaminomethyl(34) synthesis GTPase MnmE [Spirochaeta thermophila]|uniref:tRNA modification GTPase MnmE n=1 Tax=Winmispira thermophila (strain ATCC 49972 / DSM 6192 / RI 19.B1) TaxID=665571 RepID=E0RP70_WINT6|nr:tRNA uridine-5-carboxymethylaminomethyl(34) synthesis GTPase MnmE [Spirochaeta thermophila]ADN01264.1 tRNA modification GTPase [Spirochaeta thermophila DSM 6192]
MYRLDDRIVALATPWGRSAIAVIRTSGVGCLEALDPLFRGRKRPSSMRGYSLAHGALVDPGTGEMLDEVLLAVFRAPHSYTGEDAAEISCHGSPAGVERIMRTLLAHGFRAAEPGEFTLRAFLNGKVDLTEAEAVHEVVSARTANAHTLALHRLEGRLHARIDAIKEKIASVVAEVEVQLDYPEEDVEHPVSAHLIQEALHEVDGLLATYRVGRLYREGVRVVLAGRTNAGKSSLFNLFMREDRAIVSEVHGTTRDYLEGWISLKGVPVLLYDTAGIRDGGDPVETEGIRRTREILSHADAVIYLVDGTEGFSEGEEALIAELGAERPLIPVWNKVDASAVLPPPEGFIPLSCRTGEGFARLEETLHRVFPEAEGGGAEVVIDSERQRDALVRCRDSLEGGLDALSRGAPLDALAVYLHDAMEALGEITGEVTREDILERIFSCFCVGK